MHLDAELDEELRVICAGQDVLPFLGRWLSSHEAEFRRLQDDMLAILAGSPDFKFLIPSARVTALQLETDDGHAELVIYWAVSDRGYYVLAPTPLPRD